MSQHTRRALLSALAAALVIPAAASAAVVELGRQIATSAGTSVSNDLYLGGGAITSSGQVLGDLAALGGTVVVNGSVAVDALVVGGSVSVLGSIGDDLRIAGGNVLIAARIEDDVAVTGGSVTVAGERIGGDLLAAAGAITVTAPVRGTVHLKGGDVYLNAPVGGDVIVTAERLRLGSAAAIAGSLTYESPGEAEFAGGATVVGATNFIPRGKALPPRERVIAIFSALAALKFFAVLLSALLLGLFFRRYATTLATEVALAPLKEFGRGVVAMIVLPVLSAILMFTVVGIPLGVVGFLSFLALLVLGMVAAPIVIGALLWRFAFKTPLAVTWKTILAGVVVLELLWFIPFLGGLLVVIASLLTVGGILNIKWRVAREWR